MNKYELEVKQIEELLKQLREGNRRRKKTKSDI